MKKKELDITKFWTEPSKVEIKKLSFGEMSDIRDSIPINVVGTMQSSKPQVGQIGLLFLQKAIVSAPFIKGSQATIGEIRDIDSDLGDYLLEQIYDFNGISPNE